MGERAAPPPSRDDQNNSLITVMKNKTTPNNLTKGQRAALAFATFGLSEALPRLGIKGKNCRNTIAVLALGGFISLQVYVAKENRLYREAKARSAAKAALVAKQKADAEAKAEADKLARCAKDDVEAAICDRYLEALAQIEDAQQGDSFSAFLDRRAQRNNDLAYCRQNPSDWSCREGQYRGQY